MKKKIISKNGIKVLAATACLAVIGTASAAWSFAKDVAKTDTISTTIEGYSEVGSIEITGCENVKLNLDSDLYTTTYGKGICWKDASASPKEIDFGTASSISADYVEDGDDVGGKTTMVREYTLTLDDKLFTYVKFSEGSGDTTQNDAVVDGSEGKSVSGTWVDNIKIKLPKLVWKENMCPKTSKQYDTMIGVLGFNKTPGGSRTGDIDGGGSGESATVTAGDNAAKVTIKFTAKKSASSD